MQFSIEGWDLDTDALEHLRRMLPVDELGGFTRTSDTEDARGVLHPAAVLRRQSVKILVISDRNTVGLCGPSRSGRQWEPVRAGVPLPRGQQRFANFVRNIGRATADTGGGDGGAYGIGKSALWMASSCGTLLIHTRTTDEDGEPVERFIGSVHGEHFYDGGQEFTGRHFVGREDGDGVIEPLTGAEAALAGRGLPLAPYHFEGEPTDGTSIVIVAPRLNLGWEVEMDRLRDAVRWHVWPKRVPGARGESDDADMNIRLGWNNNEVPLLEPLDDPEIRPYAKVLLDCVRDRKSDVDGRDAEARCGRPVKVLGGTKFRTAGTNDQNVFHISLSEGELARAAAAAEGPYEVIQAEPAIESSAPWGQIALIRREPLLLVRYEPIGGPDAAATEVGVFLSAEDPEVEAALTKAEPPAHDDWIHKIVPKDSPRDHRRTFAKRTVEEIKRARTQFLAGYRTTGFGETGGGEQLVSRQISGGLFGGLGGGRKASSPSSRGGIRSRGPQANLGMVSSDQEGEDTIHELDVVLGGLGESPQNVVLNAAGAGFDNAGPMQVDDHVSYTWTTSDGIVSEGATLATSAADGTLISLIVTVKGSLRFRPKVSVEADGAA